MNAADSIFDLVGCVIIDHALADRRGVLLSVDIERAEVLVQWKPGQMTPMRVEPGRFSVIPHSQPESEKH